MILYTRTSFILNWQVSENAEQKVVEWRFLKWQCELYCFLVYSFSNIQCTVSYNVLNRYENMCVVLCFHLRVKWHTYLTKF